MSELVVEALPNQIFILKLNRPEKGNALSVGLLQLLSERLHDFASRSDVRALVFTGVGSRHFCSGADLKEFKDLTRPPREFIELFNRVIDQIDSMPFLTASFVNGDCIGGALGIALASDFVLATEHARFGAPEVSKGLFPFVIAPRLHRKLGEQKAKALCFSARFWTANEAYHTALVSEVVEAEKFATRCQQLLDSWGVAQLETLTRGKAALEEKVLPGDLVRYLEELILRFKSS